MDFGAVGHTDSVALMMMMLTFIMMMMMMMMILALLAVKSSPGHFICLETLL